MPGVVAMGCAILNLARRRMTRGLALELGGRRRCHAMTLSVAALLMLPVALVSVRRLPFVRAVTPSARILHAGLNAVL